MSGIELVCKVLLFDLDGVLVDSTEAVELAWSEWARREGVSLSDVMEIAHGRRTVEVIAEVAPHLDAAGAAASLERAEEARIEGLREIRGARELVTSLPGTAWAVVTSGGARLAGGRLRNLGLPVPDVFVSADDVERGKPDPEPYLTAARRLRADPSDAVVIEDAPAGIASARAAGMRCIAVPGAYPIAALGAADYVVPGLDAIEVLVEGDTLRVLVPAAGEGRPGP